MRFRSAVSCLFRTFLLAVLFLSVADVCADNPTPNAPNSARPRILVSTDIGGTDFDDFQSLVHLFIYADRFDIEGLVSSPMGSTGRKQFIASVIDAYERDYENLATYSDHYPTPAQLRSLVKQGTIETAPLAGFSKPTEGSDWIIECAKRADARPLWLLMWGGLEDLAQALHDEPTIKPHLRVYFIGGPNKKWSARAYDYIEQNHPDLWFIEANSTYFGWFTGGNQLGDLGNESFVANHIRGKGALGDFFAAGIRFNSQVRSKIKMGDTPSVAYMLGNTPEDPMQGSWGGRFVRAWDRHRYLFDHPPSAKDTVETYSIVEIVYRLPRPTAAGAKAALEIAHQEFPGFADETGAWHFMYCPKEPGRWDYTVRSTDSNLAGRAGSFTATLPEPTQTASARYANWWTDDPDPALAEGIYQGAKTVSRWREDYLRDFANCMDRCQVPKGHSSEK
jgi:hypothetical protein